MDTVKLRNFEQHLKYLIKWWLLSHDYNTTRGDKNLIVCLFTFISRFNIKFFSSEFYIQGLSRNRQARVKDFKIYTF